MQPGVVVQKNRALSVDRCWLQVLQSSVYLVDLLSTLLRCTGFSGIQKAVVDQTGSRPPNSDRDLFLGQICLCTELVMTGCHIKSTSGHISQSDQEMVHCCVE